MASKGSPTRNTCSPACSGPTCSTSMCSSPSDALSMPWAMQAWENAQVEQKWNASPSSASTLGSTRGNAILFTTDRPPVASDGAGEAGPGVGFGGGGGEIAVEAHGNVTQEQPSARGHLDPARLHAHQSSGFQRREFHKAIGEILPEINGVSTLERLHRHLGLAHQLLDQVGADHVVLVQLHAAEDRQPAFVDRELPGGQVARVLD